MAETPIAITGLGMISPNGGNMLQTCASVRAGIGRFQEFEEYFCEPEELDWGDSELYVGAKAPRIESAEYEKRVEALLLEAIQDLIRNTKMHRGTLADAGIGVALPPDSRAGIPADFLKKRIARLLVKVSQSGAGGVDLFPSGQSGFFEAIVNASALLRQGRCSVCIVAGADSFHDDRILAWLDKEERLKSTRNKDGFIPGEAAAAVLLETKANAKKRGAKILAVLGGIGIGLESNALSSDKPSSGRGLADAVKKAILMEKDPLEIGWVACDLNGESYKAKEWALCQVALPANFRTLKHVWHPADTMGDVGAASGAILVSLAARAFEREYAPEDKCLIFGCADGGARAALILKRDSE